MTNNTEAQSIRLERILTISIVIIMTVVIGFTLFALKVILMPFFIAILLAYLFSPVIEKAAIDFKIPRSISVFILFILLFILIVFLGNSLFHNINEFINDWPKLQKEIEFKLSALSETINMDKQDLLNLTLGNLNYMSISKVIFSSFTFLGNVIVTLLFMVYILFFIHTIPDKLYYAFDSNKAEKIKRVTRNINEQVQQYLVIKTIVSFLTGLSVYLILLLLGIKFAFLWGTLAFFLNYIPSIGSFIAGIPPILTTFLQFGSAKAVLVAAIFVGIQLFWGNFIEPLVIGKRLNLSPVVILFSLLFWGWLWGVVGAILAVPLIAVIKIVFSNFPSLRPIAIFMSESDNTQ